MQVFVVGERSTCLGFIGLRSTGFHSHAKHLFSQRIHLHASFVTGYLMTGTTKRNTYECVDEHPEYLQGHSANKNGALFYFVKPDCDGEGDTGHCPPYVAGRQLTCVVCSRWLVVLFLKHREVVFYFMVVLSEYMHFSLSSLCCHQRCELLKLWLNLIKAVSFLCFSLCIGKWNIK